MAISEATALARAAAVRKTFPKGKITIAQAQQMVLAMADSQVGYASGNPNYSPYGAGKNWRTKGTWTWQGYWCYRGLSWCFDQCFGAAAAKAGIGHQGYSLPAGWAATWLGMAWMRSRGMEVPFRNAKPGDISIQSWGRTTNASDHVELVTGKWDGALPCIGFNTSSASVTTGAAVARVRRPSYPLVGTFRPDWAALVAVYNATVVAEEIIDFTKVAVALRDLGYTADEKGVRAFQSDKDDWGHNLAVDGVPGPATERELEIAVSKIDEVLNILNHHIRGDLDAEDKKGLDTGRNLPLREVIVLSGVRTNDNRKTLIRVSDQLNVVGRVAAQARDKAVASVEDIVTGIFTRTSHGLGFDWWSRNGLVLDKKHRQYPADPGSLADFIIQIYEKVTGKNAVVYDGTQKRPIGPGDPHQADLDVAVEVDES